MKKKKYNVISIDPSINQCGIAVHNSDGELLFYKLFNPEKECRDDFIEKSRSIMRQINAVKLKYMMNVEKVVIVLEIPQYWDVAGFVARESGSIFKLSFLCGMICSLGRNNEDVVTVVPNKWKGQMSKLVVANRMSRHNQYKNIDIKNINHNIMDAISIGYWYINGKV